MRRATVEDIPFLIEMGQDFHRAANLPFSMRPDAAAAALRQMITDGAVFIAGRGAIGGMLSRAWINPDWVYATEFFWWSEDHQGVRLLRVFEDWARDMGANEVRMSTLEHIPANRILKRRGYVRFEMSYGKVL